MRRIENSLHNPMSAANGIRWEREGTAVRVRPDRRKTIEERRDRERAHGRTTANWDFTSTRTADARLLKCRFGVFRFSVFEKKTSTNERRALLVENVKRTDVTHAFDWLGNDMGFESIALIDTDRTIAGVGEMNDDHCIGMASK